MFTDIEGSTALWESHPSEQVNAAITRHDEILRQTVEACGGHVFKMVGDACCAAFSSPQNALLAAIECQRRLFSEEWGGGMILRVRMALHTGLSEERGGDYFGPPVNRVARLLSAGHGGQVLLSAVTYGLVRDPLTHAEPEAELPYMGEHRLKDLRYAERIFQLVVPDLPREFPPLRTHGLIEATPTPGTNTPLPERSTPYPPRSEPADERYKRIRPLGGGGMAEVFLARDEKLDQEVALKVLRPQYADNEQFVERFRREARSAAKLRSHPNIVPIYDRGETEDGVYYIVMEYLSGGTLEDLIRKNGPLSPERALAITSQVAMALRESHRLDMIHRDIKPQNILLTEYGEAKVADFGIARAASMTTLTLEGSVMGTPHYISPEQAKGEDAGPQSDLYSLGIVLYEMLTAELPFAATTPVGMMMKHISEAARPPKEVNSDVPEALNAVAMRLLAKEPSERHPSAEAFVKELERLDLAASTTGGDAIAGGSQTITDGSAASGAVGTYTILDPPPETGEPETGGEPRRGSEGDAGGAAGNGAELSGGDGSSGDGSGGGGRGGRRERRTMPWVVAGVGLAVVAALLLVPFFLLGGRDDPPSGAATVPNVAGDSRGAAAEELRAAGFEVEVESVESSAETEGMVISQNPVGGEGAPAGSTATIIVGEGLSGEPSDEQDAEAEETGTDETEEAASSFDAEEAASSFQTEEAASSFEAEEATSGFEAVSDGPLSLEVPVLWSDYLTGAESEEGSGWSDLGLVEASITASPNVESWSNIQGSVPGVYAVASQELAEEHTNEELVSMRGNDFSETCESGGESDFERSGFSGKVKEWTNCGGVSDAGFFSLSATPEGGDCVVLMSIGMVGDADRVAAQRILDTFEADCGESADSDAPEGGPVAEPSSIFASATSPAAPDAAGQEISYEPEKAVDGENDTAWNVDGDGVGEYITLEYSEPVTIGRVGILPGYDKLDPSDDTYRFYQLYVIREAEIEFSDGTAVEASFEREPEMQFVEFPQTETEFVTIRITASYPPGDAPDGTSYPYDLEKAAISEIEVEA